MPTAIIYARFSPRPGADTCESNQLQISECKRFCAEKGYEIHAIYQEEAISGGDNGKDVDIDTHDRPLLWEAIEGLRKGFIFLVHKTDRLSRSVYLSEYIRRIVKGKGARIESVIGVNGESPADNMVRQILQAFHEYERKLIGERTKAAVLRRQSNGISVTQADRVPFGYEQSLESCPRCGGKTNTAKCKYCKGRGTVRVLKEIPDEMWIIKQSLAMQALGTDPAEIAVQLKKAGKASLRKRPMTGYWLKEIIFDKASRMPYGQIDEENMSA